MNNEYQQAVEQAKANLADVKERGGDALGSRWEDVRKTLMTPEERAASAIRVAVMGELIKARNERNITKPELERLSGVSQPLISRMETGDENTRLDTVVKVLASLGKTLYVGDLQEA